MGKNVAVFVDVANIFYAAKAAGVDIDYVTLLKAAIAGRDFVRAYAYTGLDPDNENQRNFHSFLARHGYKVVSKDIRKYGDGKVKANLDIELVVDMLKTARNLDVAIVVSGDGDFAPAIRAVQEMGVRVEVISFRGNTSSDLIEVADIFTDITQLAKVERGSRSGRRVSEDEFDMSMTEVPDKQTEGASQRQRRTRGRGRADEVAARGRESADEYAAAGRRGAESRDADGGRSMTVMPGEKLSRVARPAGEPGVDEIPEYDGLDEGAIAVFRESDTGESGEAREAGEGIGGEEPRRRRRRGGRGRGRGRGRPEDGLEGVAEVAEGGEPEVVEPRPAERPARQPDRGPRGDRAFRPERARPIEEEPAPAARGPRPTPFGSIWDSQLGVPTGPALSPAPLSDLEEDLEEPEIPEYLLAERRRGGQGQGQGQGGGRGRGQGGRARAGYSAAVDRERYGRGGLNRYGEPNRPPQPHAQPQQPPQRPPRRDDRPPQPVRAERVPRSDEPWSEVPPEIEELLRAQMASRPQQGANEQQPAGRRPAGEPGADKLIAAEVVPSIGDEEAEAGAGASTGAGTAARGRGRGRRTGTATEPASAGDQARAAASAELEAAAKPRRGRPAKATAAATADAAADVDGGTAAAGTATRRRGRRPATGAAPEPEVVAAGGGASAGGDAAAAPESAPKRRGRPPKASSASEAESTADVASSASPARTTRGRRTATAATTDAPAEAAAEVTAPARRRRTSQGTGTAD